VDGERSAFSGSKTSGYQHNDVFGSRQNMKVQGVRLKGVERVEELWKGGVDIAGKRLQN